jgi:hypothetical protein
MLGVALLRKPWKEPKVAAYVHHNIGDGQANLQYSLTGIRVIARSVVAKG